MLRHIIAPSRPTAYNGPQVIIKRLCTHVGGNAAVNGDDHEADARHAQWAILERHHKLGVLADVEILATMAKLVVTGNGRLEGAGVHGEVLGELGHGVRTAHKRVVLRGLKSSLHLVHRRGVGKRRLKNRLVKQNVTLAVVLEAGVLATKAE